MSSLAPLFGRAGIRRTRASRRCGRLALQALRLAQMGLHVRDSLAGDLLEACIVTALGIAFMQLQRLLVSFDLHLDVPAVEVGTAFFA